jgi:hypothetical protein
MSDSMNAKSLEAIDDLVGVMTKWVTRVGAEVHENVQAAQTNGITAGDVAAWSVKAVELMVDGAIHVATAVLDGAAQFTVGGQPKVDATDTTVTVTNSSPLPAVLHVGLRGLNTAADVEAARITVTPATVPPGTTSVTVAVDLGGLGDDLYIGEVTSQLGAITARPASFAFDHRTV